MIRIPRIGNIRIPIAAQVLLQKICVNRASVLAGRAQHIRLNHVVVIPICRGLGTARVIDHFYCDITCMIHCLYCRQLPGGLFIGHNRKIEILRNGRIICQRDGCRIKLILLFGNHEHGIIIVRRIPGQDRTVILIVPPSVKVDTNGTI